MEEDVTKIYEEYSEELLFCKYFIAEKLKHHAEMGRCGENILKKCLQERFQMLEFVTGFIAWANHQSPQCDIIVCRKNFYRRQLAGDIFLVEPNDCIMVIEVNKKKLTQWQDRFWEHMVKKYPDLERGESASETGRDHIPPRVFKEMTRLTKQKTKLEELLSGVNAFNAKGKAAEIGAFLDKYIPAVEQMHTTLKKYNTAFTVTTAENKKLKKKTEQLEQSLDKATQESTLKKLADAKLHRDYEDAVAVLDRIPKEVLAAYTHRTEKERETAYGR